MISTDPKALLGIGLYTPEEAAEYARITVRTMKRWIWGDNQGKAVIKAQLSGTEEEGKIVTFLDFVQSLAVRACRIPEISAKKFPLEKIRAACELARDKYNISFPLAARDHKIFIFGPTSNLLKCEMVIAIGPDKADEEERLLQLTGKKSGNYIFMTIAEPFLSGLRFGETQFAERYVAHESKQNKGMEIVMDPHLRFGEPYLPSCGYTARALWEAYQSEGGIERAAKAYGVSREDVQLACEYFDILIGSNAA